MNSRFQFPVVVLALSLAVVMGTALLGKIGAGFTFGANPVLAVGTLLKPMITILTASAVAGAIGWVVLFALRRDGFHRMEWIAFLPFNYGGKSPFDTTGWRS